MKRGIYDPLTPHFHAYKEGPSHMIKSLNLVLMEPLDAEGMNFIVKKATATN